MTVTLDDAKSERNRRIRGVGFEAVAGLDWSTAFLGVSRVQNFDTSTRFFAVGCIGDVVHTVILTFEGGGYA